MTNHFQHILSVENNRSTQADSRQRYLAAVQQACAEIPAISVALDEHLGDSMARIEPDTLICISGGDGTVSSVVQTLLESPGLSAEQRKTPVLPLWCGNANDIAHMLNGRASAAKCKTIVEQGAAVPIYPLRCELVSPDNDETVVRLALGYVSLGVSARTAQSLNEPSFRHNRFHAVPGFKPVNEVLLLLDAMYSSSSFSVEQDGQTNIIYDWIISKGPRMAKNVKLPVQLTDHAYYQSVVRKNLPEVASRLGGMASGLLEPTLDTKPITFTTQEPVWAQFDGEPIQLAAGTKVTISLNPTPFYALSTSLPKTATLKA